MDAFVLIFSFSLALALSLLSFSSPAISRDEDAILVAKHEFRALAHLSYKGAIKLFRPHAKGIKSNVIFADRAIRTPLKPIRENRPASSFWWAASSLEPITAAAA